MASYIFLYSPRISFATSPAFLALERAVLAAARRASRNDMLK